MPALPNLRLISHKSSICFFERFAWQAVFSRPFFQKNYPHSLAKCLSCRCRQQREKYAALRQEQSVSCQSKILPRCHNSLSAHSAPSESCWGVPSPNPAIRSLTAAAISPSGRAFASSIAAQGFENRLSRNRFPQKSFSHRHTQQTADFCPLKSRKGKTWNKTGG